MNEISIKSKDFIYESPDGGKTVYKRKIGNWHKVLHSSREPDLFTYAEITEIKELSKTKPALKKALDNLLLIYYTIKDDKSTS
jgi:hypothetical protein